MSRVLYHVPILLAWAEPLLCETEAMCAEMFVVPVVENGADCTALATMPIV